jgi:hypothetical protein
VIQYYGLDFKCLPKAHVLKAWPPMQQCLEVGSLGGDCTMRALTSQIN